MKEIRSTVSDMVPLNWHSELMLTKELLGPTSLLFAIVQNGTIDWRVSIIYSGVLIVYLHSPRFSS